MQLRSFAARWLSTALALASALGFGPATATAQTGTFTGRGGVGVPPPLEERPGVILQGLDKVTARVTRIEVPVGYRVRFHRLMITVRACRQTHPTEAPESTAFLEIVDISDQAAPVAYFSGWMFASSPALSPLEHPVYDVTVLGCTAASSAASSDKQR
jgi:hypothetical protein